MGHVPAIETFSTYRLWWEPSLTWVDRTKGPIKRIRRRKRVLINLSPPDLHAQLTRLRGPLAPLACHVARFQSPIPPILPSDRFNKLLTETKIKKRKNSISNNNQQTDPNIERWIKSNRNPILHPRILRKFSWWALSVSVRAWFSQLVSFCGLSDRLLSSRKYSPEWSFWCVWALVWHLFILIFQCRVGSWLIQGLTSGDPALLR